MPAEHYAVGLYLKHGQIALCVQSLDTVVGLVRFAQSLESAIIIDETDACEALYRLLWSWPAQREMPARHYTSCLGGHDASSCGGFSALQMLSPSECCRPRGIRTRGLCLCGVRGP